MHVGLLRGVDDLVHGHVARVVSVRDVLADGAREQRRLLLHQPQLLAQLRQGQGALDVFAVQLLVQQFNSQKCLKAKGKLESIFQLYKSDWL